MPAEGYCFERFWSKVQGDFETGCWVWLAGHDKGYGRFSLHGRPVSAYRYSYRQFVGPIPSWLQIDHLCRNRACVNPAHMELVTSKENSLRSPLTLITQRTNKTHCPQGHPYDAKNTILYKGRRYCRACMYRRNRDYKRRQRGH